MKRKAARTYSFEGVTLPLKEWATLLGIPAVTLYHRIHVQGLSVPDAFTRPQRKGGRPPRAKGITTQTRDHHPGTKATTAEAATTQPPGYVETLPLWPGTGGGSLANDLQIETGMEG